MSQEPKHPREAPGNLYKSFLIDAAPDKLSKSISDIDGKIRHLDDRIQRLIEKFTVNNMPLMEFVLNFANDPEELLPFAEGLDRAAKLSKLRKELQAKRLTLSSLKENPSWFMGELNDFSTEIDELLSISIKQSEE